METDSDLIFVDIGVTLSTVNGLMEQIWTADKKVSLLITHEHTDHISGIVPFIRRFHPEIYTSAGTAGALSGKIDTDNIITMQRDGYYDADTFAISPFDICHDAAEPFGFVVMTSHGNAGFATDLGCITDKQLKPLEISDILVIEANHDKEMLRKGSYPYYLKRRISGHRGHLSNDDTMAALSTLHTGNLKHCLFAHISEENNSYELLTQYAAFCENAYGLDVDVLQQKQYSCFDIDLLELTKSGKSA